MVSSTSCSVSGILYHLDAPDVFAFVEKLGEVCRKICIVDTRITLHPKASRIYNNKTYFGTTGDEHDPEDSKEKKMSRLWASLSNIQNFYLSGATVCNLLSDVGFTSVYQLNIPAQPDKPADRVTFVAIKGAAEQLLTAPLMADRSTDRMPERPRRENSLPVDVLRQISKLLPRRIRRFGKTLIGRDNKLT